MPDAHKTNASAIPLLKASNIIHLRRMEYIRNRNIHSFRHLVAVVPCNLNNSEIWGDDVSLQCNQIEVEIWRTSFSVRKKKLTRVLYRELRDIILVEPRTLYESVIQA